MFTRSNRRSRSQTARQDKTENIPIKALNWKRVFSFLRPYWRRMTLAIIMLLISTGLGLAFPLVIMQLLTAATQVKSYTPLNLLTLTLVGMFFFQAVFTFLQNYLMSYIGEHIVYDL